MPLDAELSALAQAIRNPDPRASLDTSPAFAPRLDVYRRLVRDRFISAVTTTLPRTAALLGAERTTRLVDEFLDAEGVRSPYFREVAGELARFMDRARAPYSDLEIDTGRFEATRFEVAVSPPDDDRPNTPLELGRAIRFSAAARIFSARSAVHREPSDGPPSQLLIYRTPSGPHLLELSNAAATILRALQAGDTLAEGIRGGAERAGVPLTPAVMEEISALLTDLGERGVVLGAL